MKNSFWAIAVFFAVFLTSLLFAACGYYLYFNCSWLAAGAPAELQPPMLFFEGIFAVWGVCAVVSLLPVIFYFIQFKIRFGSALCVWLFLCFTVFAVLQPLSFVLSKKFSVYVTSRRMSVPVYVEDSGHTIFTAGFFRELSGSRYYFTEVSKTDKFVSGLQIPVEAGRAAAGKAVEINRSVSAFKEISGIPDPLIERTITLPLYAAKCIQEIQSLSALGARAFAPEIRPFSQAFFSSYAGFASIGLSVLGLFAFIVFSSWRLLNVLFLPVCYALILHVNYLLQCVPGKNALAGFLSFLPPGQPQWLSALLVNFLIFAVLFLAGIWGKGLRKKQQPEEAAE